MALQKTSWLEDQSHPLLGPNLYGLQCWGMWQPNRLDRYYNIMHTLAFLFVLTQYIELWIIRSDLEMALRNLSVTMLSSVCVFKAATFVYWQKYWRTIVEFVADSEIRQLSKCDTKTMRIIAGYTKYSRWITYFYWGLTTATVFSVILAPLFEFLSYPDHQERMRNGTMAYPEVLSSWVPFERTRGTGYWVTIVEHSLICFYGGGVVASYDSIAVVIMSFFAGQLDLLSANCARLFGEGNEIINNDEVVKRIKQCHFHHLNLIRFSNVLNSLLSPVMFLYVIICSLMICASAVQLTMEGISNLQRVWVAEYLVALIAQLFMYCWHSNEVMNMSNEVSYGIYSSAWWSQNMRVRRSVVLLGGQLRKPIVFTAGPFTKLNIATFITILKGSYSYYTLLSKIDD